MVESESHDEGVETLSKKVCTLFLKGKCIKDFNCPYSHVKPTTAIDRKPVSKPVHKSLQNVTAEERVKLERQLELDSLKIRYKDDLVVEEDNETKTTLLLINHPITDPDFPYDLPFLLLQFTLPVSYQEEPVSCKVLNSEIPSEICAKIDSYLVYNAKLLKGQCCIKNLISTLEKNLESLMIAKPSPSSSSIKIVSFPHAEKGAEKRFETTEIGLPNASHAVQNSLRSIQNPMVRSFPVPMPSGFTQQSAQISCELKNWKGVSVALLLQFSLQFQCPKCKTHNSFDNMLPSSVYIVKCTKCDTQFTGEFYAEYLHQTSPNLAYVQLKGSPLPVSISKCTFQLECDECDDFQYQNKLLNLIHVSSVNSGDDIRSSCRKCNQKMYFSFGNVVFSAPASASTKSSQVKQQKIVGLTIGQPLPEFGTCKHYKKSFRWLRFPCCGKVFPCDTCHDEATTDGHKSVWATRMICGHCSREAVFSNSKCVCGNHPTDQRHTTYWEGGKGSRNQATMSRKDSRKYKGQNK